MVGLRTISVWITVPTPALLGSGMDPMLPLGTAFAGIEALITEEPTFQLAETQVPRTAPKIAREVARIRTGARTGRSGGRGRVEEEETEPSVGERVVGLTGVQRAISSAGLPGVDLNKPHRLHQAGPALGADQAGQPPDAQRLEEAIPGLRVLSPSYTGMSSTAGVFLWMRMTIFLGAQLSQIGMETM